LPNFKIHPNAPSLKSLPEKESQREAKPLFKILPLTLLKRKGIQRIGFIQTKGVRLLNNFII